MKFGYRTAAFGFQKTQIYVTHRREGSTFIEFLSDAG
jgi:hypothetical protein